MADPTDIAGLAAWYKADAGVTDDGGASVWADQSGNGRDLAQATEASRPATGTRTLNTRNVLDFDGTDDFLDGSSSFTFAHMLIVATNDAAVNFPSFNGLVGGTAVVGLIGTGNRDYFFNDTGVTGLEYHLDGTSYPRTEMTAPMNGDFGIISYARSSGSWSLTPRIGSDRGLAGRYWNGGIAEIVLYSSILSTANREAVEDYLTTRWFVAPVVPTMNLTIANAAHTATLRGRSHTQTLAGAQHTATIRERT